MDSTPKPATTVAIPARLPRAVVVLGFVSLLNDFASEMVVPLIPLLLATALAAGPAILGLIEGVADAISNLLKLWAGRRSDMAASGRKPFVVAGYLLSNIARPLIGISGSWTTVLAIRVTDRIGKGVRTAPRDALLADAIVDGQAGRAYGFTRALDHAGAVLGALAAAAVVHFGTERLDIVIALSAIPGIAAVALIGMAVNEPHRFVAPEPVPPLPRWSALSPALRRYLLALGLFMFGRIPETFMLLRGHALGMSVVELLLFWAALHVVKASLSEFAGRVADRIGRRPIIASGWLVYAVTLLALAFVDSASGLWTFGLVLGIYFGLAEGAERALVRDLAHAAGRGTAFGWYHMVAGISAIPAGLLLGGLWSLFGVAPAFIASAALTALATVGFLRWVHADEA